MASSSYLGEAMTIQVNIGEAKTRLSELIAASERGETVVLARAGKVVAHIVPPPDTMARAETLDEAAARRRAAFARNAADFAGKPYDHEPSMTDAELDERWQRKFGTAG